MRENPRSNLVLAAVVVFWLTKWLNSRVDRRHNPAWYEGKKDGDAEKGESDEKKSGMQRSMSLTEMAVAVADASSRSTRLKRAREVHLTALDARGNIPRRAEHRKCYSVATDTTRPTHACHPRSTARTVHCPYAAEPQHAEELRHGGEVLP